MAFIAFGIAVEFGQPPFTAVRGGCAILTALVAMPEAAVNEDDGFVFGQDNVGTAREFGVVEAEAVAEAVEEGADEEFGLRILVKNSSHIPTPMSLRQFIFGPRFQFLIFNF